jgi:hypothetical protein
MCVFLKLDAISINETHLAICIFLLYIKSSKAYLSSETIKCTVQIVCIVQLPPFKSLALLAKALRVNSLPQIGNAKFPAH